MRAWIVLGLVACGGEPAWQRESGGLLELNLGPEDPSADGLVVAEEFTMARPDSRVFVEIWEEQRGLIATGSPERWARVSVTDVVVEGADCTDTVDLTLWWDSVNWDYGISVDGLDDEGPRQRVIDNTGSQILDFGFIRGTFTLAHPCIVGTDPVLYSVSATWQTTERERGLMSPPPDERR